MTENRSPTTGWLPALVGCILVLAACGGGSDATGTTSGSTTTVPADPGGCADVVDVEVRGDGPYRFDVTVSSADTGWDKYADEWRVATEDGDVLGVRELAHPHVDEQPFTRSLSGVEIDAPATVVVAARDSVAGYCGETMTLEVPAGTR